MELISIRKKLFMMSLTRSSIARSGIAVALAASVGLFGFAFAIQTAHADINPAGCLANDFTTQLNKSVSAAYDETSPNGATTITYSVAAGNPQNVALNGCNVDGVTITLTTPDGVVHTLQTGGNYPVGTAIVLVGAPVTYVAHSTDIVGGDFIVSATATGALHDKVGGTDPLTSGKTVSVSAIHPNTTVTITPSATPVTAGGTVNLTITEHNTGDDPLTASTVTLTPPGTTLATSSASFSGGDTNSNGILDPGETWTWVVTGIVVSANTTYTAVGDGIDELGNHVTFSAYPNEKASTTVNVLNHPSVTTTLSGNPVSVGNSVHDTATLSGATATAGGTVTYTAYTDAACSLGAQSAGTKTVTSGIVPDSDPLTFNTAGTYNWQDVYSGDANNTAATSTCQSEALVVNKSTPRISTIPSAGGPVGTVLNDTATLAGGSSPTGNVVFNLYAPTDATCSATPVYTNTSAAAPYATSPGFTSNAAGIWHWTATYAGDANNSAASSTCADEAVTTTLSAPTIATNLSATSVTPGTAVHDSSTLSGATATAGGTVTYTVYTDSECSLGAVSAGTKTVTNALVPASNNVTLSTPGTFYWQAAYSGDANNLAATSTCGSEIVTVGKFTPSVSTTLSTSNTSTSTPVHDSATLSGASADAGGTATYSVFTNTACTAGMMPAGTKTVVGGVIPNSDPLTFATPGTYYWQVVYSGDAKNAAATSACTREVLTITAPTPPVTGCEVDWKPVGTGWMDFGPLVYLNRNGRMLSANNPCPLKLPLRFSPGPTKPTN